MEYVSRRLPRAEVRVSDSLDPDRICKSCRSQHGCTGRFKNSRISVCCFTSIVVVRRFSDRKSFRFLIGFSRLSFVLRNGPCSGQRICEDAKRMRTAKEVIELWPIRWLVVIGFLVLIKWIIARDLSDILRHLVTELSDLARRRYSAASLDMFIIIGILLMGLVTIVGLEFGEVARLSAELGLERKAGELRAAARPEFLVLTVGFISLMSVWITR